MNMKKYRYLYLDDDIHNAEIFKDGIEESKLIAISKVSAPDNFDLQLKELVKEQNNFDGILLDLKLDGYINGNKKAHYTAMPIAHEIRTKAREKKWKKEFPIVLVSTKENFKKYYNLDTPSHGLFDIRFVKENIDDAVVSLKMHAIVKAYIEIAKNRPHLEKILAIKDLDALDKRIFNEELLKGKKAIIFDYANFILKEMIFKPGPLIDENILAARLGIDIKKSKSWKPLKDKILNKFQYKGIYSEAWERWWMYQINEWWESISKNTLAELDAKERVGILKSKLKLQSLTVATPIDKAKSYNFWTICHGFDRPLDPMEGLRIAGFEPLAWQDPQYISFEAALERAKREEGLRVHPSELDRLNQIKKAYKK